MMERSPYIAWACFRNVLRTTKQSEGKMKINFVNTHLFFIHERFERKMYGFPENQKKPLPKVYLLLTILCWNNIYWSPVLENTMRH